MLLTIYDKDGAARAEIAAGDSSTQQKEVQGDNVLALSFTHYEHVALDVGWYTDFLGERYWLMERYAPKQKSGGEWAYDVKLYGIESLIKRFLVLETTDGDAEPVFTLTAPPGEHVAMIVKCVNDGMGTADWKAGRVDGADNITVDYEGTSCDEALKAVAEKVGGQAEWWAEGQTVNVCRCEQGEEITLGYGNGLTELECDTSNTEGFYTRLFPIGSSRNIDPGKYGHSRLMLPGGRKSVELHTDEYGIYDRYEKDAFSGIYPRRTGTVSSVRSEAVTDDEGNAFTIYYFKDNSLSFDPNEYELAGETKRVSFQDGELGGLGTGDDHYFEVNYDSGTREFEIITIWPYDDGTQLPGGALVPKEGDHYILWNIRMPDEYYTMAENELAEAVEKYNEEHWRDLSVYKGATDHVWMENHEADLYVGRRVRLESDKYFPETGYRSSRITKITRKVNLPSQMDLEISDALQTGALDKVSDQIGQVKTYVRDRTESLALPDIIRSGDSTLPTDNNLFSARRSQQEFLGKKKADRAKKRITFEEGIGIGREDNGEIDGAGNASLLSAVILDYLRSPAFRSGLTGEGWRLWLDGAGLANLEVDRLTVRQTMAVMELLIERIRAVGGQLCVSAANGKIKTVEEQGDYYRITFDPYNSFQEHDLIRCQTFTGTGVKSYWAEVSSSDANGVTVAKSEFGDTVPEPGDECVLMGSTENALRQNLVLVSATEDGQPRVDVYNGVSEKSFSGCLRARLGNLDGISDSWFPADNQPRGDGLYADNAYLRGTFLLTTGEDIKTKFEITEGRLESAMESLRSDIGAQGILANPDFASGLDKWRNGAEAGLVTVGGLPVTAGGGALTVSGGEAEAVADGGRAAVRISGAYIAQAAADMLRLPSFADGADGRREAAAVTLTVVCRCVSEGTLRARFENVDKAGFAPFAAMDASARLAPSEGYTQLAFSGLWNGTGSLALSFTGEMYASLLLLAPDGAGTLAHRYRTLLEQSDRLVRLSAAVYDKDDALIRETGLVVKPEGSGLYAQDAAGNTALVGVTVEEEGRSVVKLTADHISLEGLVTANSNFKVLEDGSVSARNGTFEGTLRAADGWFAGLVRKEQRTVTPALAAMYLRASSFNGWRDIDLEAAGSLVCFEGDFASVLGGDGVALRLPVFLGGDDAAATGEFPACFEMVGSVVAVGRAAGCAMPSLALAASSDDDAHRALITVNGSAAGGQNLLVGPGEAAVCRCVWRLADTGTTAKLPAVGWECVKFTLWAS